MECYLIKSALHLLQAPRARRHRNNFGNSIPKNDPTSFCTSRNCEGRFMVVAVEQLLLSRGAFTLELTPYFPLYYSLWDGILLQRHSKSTPCTRCVAGQCPARHMVRACWEHMCPSHTILVFSPRSRFGVAAMIIIMLTAGVAYSGQTVVGLLNYRSLTN